MSIATIPSQQPSVRRRGRSVWVLLGAVVSLLVVAGIAAVIVARRDASASYPANSPEGTVQRYVGLLQNGQTGRAYAMVSTSETQTEFDAEYGSWANRSHQVVLVTADRRASTADVTVEITGFDAGPFGASNDSQRVIFHLIRQGRGWIITDPPYLPY